MGEPSSRRDFVVAVCVLMLPVALLLWFHVAVAAEWSESRSLASRGVPTEAIVVDREALSGPRTEGYRVTYRFEAPGTGGEVRMYTSTADVDRSTYDALAVDSPAEIRYDADDPTQSDLARNDRVASMLFILVVIDVAVVAVGLSIVRAGRSEQRTLPLAHE